MAVAVVAGSPNLSASITWHCCIESHGTLYNSTSAHLQLLQRLWEPSQLLLFYTACSEYKHGKVRLCIPLVEKSAPLPRMDLSTRPGSRANGQRLTRRRVPLSCVACRVRKCDFSPLMLKAVESVHQHIAWCLVISRADIFLQIEVQSREAMPELHCKR